MNDKRAQALGPEVRVSGLRAHFSPVSMRRMLRALVVVAWAAGLGLSLTGCASRGPKPAISGKAGFVNIDVLVHSHPGWSEVSRFDKALARLESVDGLKLASVVVDPALSALPPVSAQTPRVSQSVLEHERFSLRHEAQVQMDRFRENRAEARRLRLDTEESVWKDSAAHLRDEAVQAAQAAYRARIAAAVRSPENDVLNLGLQIDALKKTIADYEAIRNAYNRLTGILEPAPWLDQVRNQLTGKEAQRAVAATHLDAEIRAAAVDRDAAVRAADAGRRDYVEGHRADLLRTLTAEDAKQLRLQQDRLGRRIAAIERVRPDLAAIPPPMGDIGPTALDLHLPATGAPPFDNGIAVRKQILAQRQRWIDFLYDDTRAAVRDAAEASHRSITFGGSGAAGEDLTVLIEHQLKMSVWRG